MTLLLNLRVLLVKEFNRKINGLEQSDVANINMRYLRQVLDVVDLKDLHFFFLSLRPEHRLVFDMGTNLTDLSYFNVPSKNSWVCLSFQNTKVSRLVFLLYDNKSDRDDIK